MKVEDFLDVVLTDYAIKINGKLVIREENQSYQYFKMFEGKEIIAIRIHHNCVKLEVA